MLNILKLGTDDEFIMGEEWIAIRVSGRRSSFLKGALGSWNFENILTLGGVFNQHWSNLLFNLLGIVELLAEDIQPLLAEIRDSAVLKDVEILTKSLAEATEELRLRSSILTPENMEIFRRSIFTLIYTLKNLESISSDISVFTSDEATRQNIKMLIKSLSRIL